MNRALLFALALSCLPVPTRAQSYFPPYPVPVPAIQGGTGQTSFTTNCLVAASSSTALTCTGSPTISGANLTAGTVPNAALVTAPVTNVTASGNIASSGGTTPAITFTGVLPCANGGTNIASGLTAGAILTASGGCSYTVVNAVATGSVLASAGTGTQPAYTSAPAISGANFTAGTITNSGLAPGCTTYTPTDQSGASLTITVVQANYCTIAAKLVWVSVKVTYPANVSGAVAQLSLPVANSGTVISEFTTLISGVVTNGITAQGDTGGNVIFVNTASSLGGNTNATLTTMTISFAGVYRTV